MASYKNFSKKSRAELDNDYNNFDNPASHSVSKDISIDYDSWVNFLSYYRYYVDRFIIDCLEINIYHFQKYIIRALTHYKEGMLICSRGLGKSWLTALFAIAMCILYPGLQVVIVASNGKQARSIITKKIQNQLYKHDSIKREISNIKTQTDDCCVSFKNGSIISAVALGQGKGGDGVRGERANLILVDEARLVDDKIISTVIEPMAKNKRDNIMKLQDMYPNEDITERNKVLFMSSAYLKTCDLYKRFLMYYKSMVSGVKDMFVCSFSYTIGESVRMYDKGEIEKERNKVTMTAEEFSYEYEGVFVGSSNESYYPYELTNRCRVLKKCETKQPKNCNYGYIITHDVAVSGKTNSDNACTHVIKLIPKGDGNFIKEVVFTEVMNGAELSYQRDFLRELVHIKFPNTEKLVIDAQSAGEGLLALLAEPWSCINEKGDNVEYSPLLSDDDDGIRRANEIGGEPIIRAIRSTETFNNDFYPYMKAGFQNETIRLLVSSVNTDEDRKDNLYSLEEHMAHVHQDILIQELSNIKQYFSNGNKLLYGRIVQNNKRDRATSLMYGMSVICEYEKEEQLKLSKKKVNDEEYLMSYLYY